MKNLFATAPVVKEKKKSRWNFKRKSERNQPDTFGNKVTCAAGGLYKFGPFTAALDEIKAYARTLKLEFIKMGAVTIKL